MDALSVVSYANTVGEVALFVRLASLGLIKKYRWFAVWLAFSAIQDAASSFTAMESDQFSLLWKITEPVLLGLEVLVVFEVYELMAKVYPGAAQAGKWVLSVSLGLALVASLILGIIDWRGVTPWIFLVKRSVTSVLVVFLLCVGWVFLLYPPPISRNLVYHCRILTLYLGGVAVGYFGINLGINRPLVSLLFLSCCLVCLMLWGIYFRRDGERSWPSATPEDFERNSKQAEELVRKIEKMRGKKWDGEDFKRTSLAVEHIANRRHLPSGSAQPEIGGVGHFGNPLPRPTATEGCGP